MGQITITGGRPLQGEVPVQGAKNSVLPILAASLLSGTVTVLRNCPHLRDVDVSLQIIRHLGGSARWEGDDLILDTADLCRQEIPDELMREMRSSAVFLGAILARCRAAEMTYPGGCELGPRPIDLHLSGLRHLGADITESGGRLRCTAAKLRGDTVVLGFPSVGATENLMLAACGAEGVTTILHPAREPEIVDLQQYLCSCGAKVDGAGTDCITVIGGVPLHESEFSVMPDRIVTATYLCAAASAGGTVRLRGAREEHLTAVTSLLREAGCAICSDAGGILCRCDRLLRAVSPVRTAPYPGFPTDAQAILMAAMLRSQGTTVFEENIFSGRYRHVDELIRLGGDIRVSGRTAVVTGAERLTGAHVCAADLRGGAALCVAALAAEGTSVVEGLRHIDRGYENITRDLLALGAEIQREDD